MNQAWHQCGAQIRVFFRDRIHNRNRIKHLMCFRIIQSLQIILMHKAVIEYLGQAAVDQRIFDKYRCFLFLAHFAFRDGTPWSGNRNVGIAVNTGFFCQIMTTFYIQTEFRNRYCNFTIVIFYLEVQSGQDISNLFIWKMNSDVIIDGIERGMNYLFRLRIRIFIQHISGYCACALFFQDLADTIEGFC